MFILNEIMKEMKITSLELAEKTGIPKRTIDEHRGSRRKEPSLSNGLKIADALGIDPHSLFDDDTTLFGRLEQGDKVKDKMFGQVFEYVKKDGVPFLKDENGALYTVWNMNPNKFEQYKEKGLE